MPLYVSLDESWVGVYLQIVASIFIFGMGLPALAVQVTRGTWEVIRKRRFALAVGGAILAVPILTTLFLIWLLPRCGNSVLIFRLWPLVDVVEVLGLEPPAWLALQLALEPPLVYQIVVFSMVASVFSTLFFWIFLDFYGRNQVLHRLTWRCIRAVKRKGIVHEEALQTIGDLGEQSTPGREKTRVLEALARLAEQVQAQGKYAGNGLEPILQAIESTLRSDRDVDDLLFGTEIIGKAIATMQRRELVLSPDMGGCLRSLERIGVQILDADSEEAALAILQAITPIVHIRDGVAEPVARVLFELGTVAMSRKLYAFGVRALNELEGIAGRELSADRVSAAYLGLVAHFWAAGGVARERARQSVALLGPRPVLKKKIDAAHKCHTTSARFETVDKLSLMLADMEWEQSGALSRWARSLFGQRPAASVS